MPEMKVAWPGAMKVVNLRGRANGSKDELVHGLNQDMAAEWGQILAQLRLITSGNPSITSAVREAIADHIKHETEHVRDLANAVLDLGGEPTRLPRDYPQHDDPSEMCRLNAEIELELANRYDQRAMLAETFGENLLAERIRNMATSKRAAAAACRDEPNA